MINLTYKRKDRRNDHYQNDYNDDHGRNYLSATFFSTLTGHDYS